MLTLSSPEDSVCLPVISNKEVIPGCFLISFENTTLAGNIKPGQFFMLSFPSLQDPLLPRPFACFKKEGDRFEILYQRTGKGTRLLSQVRTGEVLRILGPLGNGFPFPSLAKSPLLIAGGIGIASLNLLMSFLEEKEFASTLLYGARSASDLIPQEYLSKQGISIHTATEDGTGGFRGTVSDLFSNLSQQVPDFAVTHKEAFVCGPLPMLKHMAQQLSAAGIKGYFSLEARMACGFGVCQGCVIPGERHALQDGTDYMKVCRQGPVFSGEDIKWELL